MQASWQKFHLVGLVVLCAVVGFGCQSLRHTTHESDPGRVEVEGALHHLSAAVGTAIQPILEAAEASEARSEFFTVDSEPVETWEPGIPGSVSIFPLQGGGQDNYAYDENGIVIRHLRSYGDDFEAGVWVDAP